MLEYYILLFFRYTPEMDRLIKQFRAQRVCLQPEYPDARKFFDDYCKETRIAYHRLVEIGLPATLEHGKQQVDHKQLQYHISQAVT